MIFEGRALSLTNPSKVPVESQFWRRESVPASAREAAGMGFAYPSLGFRVNWQRGPLAWPQQPYLGEIKKKPCSPQKISHPRKLQTLSERQ